MLVKAEDLADGRWPDILAAAGVDKSFLHPGRNGPCPFCPDGGRDRYRWTDKHGGLYVCSQCTASKYRSGMDFLMRHMGYGSFREAADHVRGYFGITGSNEDQKIVERLAKEPVRAAFTSDPSKSIARMTRQWNESLAVVAGDPVHRYLMQRVPLLDFVPNEIRHHPGLEYWNPPSQPGGSPSLVGKFHAMLVRGFDANDKLVQMHKTYLTPDGRKADVQHVKKTDVGVGSNSFALRLGIPGDTLGVCEGIETGLSSSMLRGIPVWPCHSADIMANFELPQAYQGVVKKLIIFADSDHLKAGQKKGEECAKRLAARCRSMGLKSLIMRPAKVGTDFADLVA